MVRSEDPHAVQRRGRAFRRGQTAPDHLVLPQLERHKSQAAPGVSGPRSHRRARPAPNLRLLKRTTRREELNPEVERAPCARRVDLPADIPAVPLADLGPRPAGAATPPCWALAASRAMKRRSGPNGPLPSAATRHHNPPNGGLGRTAGPGCASRAPARTHGARRLHGAPPPRPAGKRETAACSDLTSPPGPGGPRGDWLRAARDWSTQLSVSARPAFPAGGARGPAQAAPVLPRARGPRPRPGPCSRHRGRGPAWSL